LPQPRLDLGKPASGEEDGMAQRAIDRAALPHPPRVSYEEWLTRPEDAGQSEWVDGEVIEFMPPKTIHQSILVLLGKLVGLFVEIRGLGSVFVAPYEMRLANSAREPDLLFVATKHLDRIDANRLTGAADLAVEIISEDSVARDRVAKFAEYEASGVGEYWIVDARPGREAVEWFGLGADGRYAAILPDAEGRLRSTVLPGFWLDPAWLRREPLPDALPLLLRIAPDALRAALDDSDA
jgi:Uma2 family endonuclease